MKCIFLLSLHMKIVGPRISVRMTEPIVLATIRAIAVWIPGMKKWRSETNGIAIGFVP